MIWAPPSPARTNRTRNGRECVTPFQVRTRVGRSRTARTRSAVSAFFLLLRCSLRIIGEYQNRNGKYETGPTHQSSLVGRPRYFLIFARRRFCPMRFSWELLVGRVGTRGRRGDKASRRRPTRRSRQAPLLRDKLRWVPARRRRTPSRLSLSAQVSMMRARSQSVKAEERAGHQNRLTRVEERLACCPPGPPCGSERKVSSLQGRMRLRRHSMPCSLVLAMIMTPTQKAQEVMTVRILFRR